MYPIGCNPQGSTVHGIFQASILEWVAILFSGDLPDWGIKPRSSKLQADCLPLEPLGKVQIIQSVSQFSHSVVSDSWRPHGLHHACQAFLSITDSWSLLKLMSVESVMAFNRLMLCYPLLLLPSIFLSIRVFSNESTLCMRWPKYWSFSFSISPFNEHPGLISFRMDWLDLLTVQGTLPIPQFTIINTLVLSFLSSPILTSIHDY